MILANMQKYFTQNSEIGKKMSYNSGRRANPAMTKNADVPIPPRKRFVFSRGGVSACFGTAAKKQTEMEEQG
jgi:hypothetical protein